MGGNHQNVSGGGGLLFGGGNNSKTGGAVKSVGGMARRSVSAGVGVYGASSGDVMSSSNLFGGGNEAKSLGSVSPSLAIGLHGEMQGHLSGQHNQPQQQQVEQGSGKKHLIGQSQDACSSEKAEKSSVSFGGNGGSNGGGGGAAGINIGGLVGRSGNSSRSMAGKGTTLSAVSDLLNRRKQAEKAKMDGILLSEITSRMSIGGDSTDHGGPAAGSTTTTNTTTSGVAVGNQSEAFFGGDGIIGGEELGDVGGEKTSSGFGGDGDVGGGGGGGLGLSQRLLEGVIEECLEDFRRELRDEIQNMHLEILRQFCIQKVSGHFFFFFEVIA
jgi:hypothetical protein